VNEWAKFPIEEGVDPSRFALQRAFENGTKIAVGPPEKYFFTQIWLPVKEVTEQGIADDWTYKNIGLTVTELADAYQTFYGFNRLSVPLIETQGYQSAYELGEKIKSVFLMNKGKYLKLLELQGYTYNPLFNVDGVEIRQSLENNGINNVSTSSVSSGRALQDQNQKSTHNVSAYDSTTKEEYNDITQGNKTGGVNNLPRVEYNFESGELESKTPDSYSDVAGQTASYGTAGNFTKYEHQTAKNGENHNEEYTVDAEDTAFKQALVGGDKMHNEKLIRQGNIGVTKTQELIEAERQNLKYSIVKEFFDDINAQILVGIY
jgi:hypothetical protein